jgi:hypothetical protein
MKTKQPNTGTITNVIAEASIYFDLPKSGILEVRLNESKKMVQASYSGIGTWTNITPKEGMNVRLEITNNSPSLVANI